MIWPGSTVLRVASHRYKKIHLHLGSCPPNLEQFLARNNLAKIENLEKSFYRPKDPPSPPPLDICDSNLSVKGPVRGKLVLLKMCHFLALGHNLGRFGHFIPGYTYFLQHFYGLKNRGQKYDVMY